jgi:hypothetical protein
MGAVREWAEDVRAARRGARGAASLPSPCERLAALTLVFQDLGEASTRYADPHKAAVTLVQVAVREFRVSRPVRVLEMAGVK